MEIESSVHLLPPCQILLVELLDHQVLHSQSPLDLSTAVSQHPTDTHLHKTPVTNAMLDNVWKFLHMLKGFFKNDLFAFHLRSQLLVLWEPQPPD